MGRKEIQTMFKSLYRNGFVSTFVVIAIVEILFLLVGNAIGYSAEITPSSIGHAIGSIFGSFGSFMMFLGLLVLLGVFVLLSFLAWHHKITLIIWSVLVTVGVVLLIVNKVNLVEKIGFGFTPVLIFLGITIFASLFITWRASNRMSA